MNIPVHISRVRPKDLASMPLVVIYNDSYGVNNTLPNSLGIAGDEQKTVNIDICFTANDDFSELLDDAVSDCLALLANADFLKANQIDTDSINVKYNYSNEMEKPLAIAQLTLTASGFKQL